MLHVILVHVRLGQAGGLGSGNVHGDVMGHGLGSGRVLAGDLHQHPDLTPQVHIAIHHAAFHMAAGKPPDGDLFADLGHGPGDHLRHGAVAGIQRHKGVHILGILLRHQFGYRIHQGLEVVGLGHEVGLTIHFCDDAGLAIRAHVAGYHALGRNAGRLLGGSRQALLPQIVHGLIHVAVALYQGLFTIHHAGAAHLAQGHYVFCGKHVFAPPSTN